MPNRKLTSKQAYVFARIDHVIPLERRLAVSSPLPRYQLDGEECTAQITGLVVKGWIAKRSEGGFQRLKMSKSADRYIGERQAPLAGSIDGIKALLTAV